jgi:twitching motility protein PilT
MVADNRNRGDSNPGRDEQQRPEPEVDRLLKALVVLRGSELHLEIAQPPRLLVRGSLKRLNRGPIYDEEMARLCDQMIGAGNRRRFGESGEIEFGYSLPFNGKIWRFRVNLRRQSGQMSLVARKVDELEEV